MVITYLSIPYGWGFLSTANKAVTYPRECSFRDIKNEPRATCATDPYGSTGSFEEMPGIRLIRTCFRAFKSISMARRADLEGTRHDNHSSARTSKLVKTCGLSLFRRRKSVQGRASAPLRRCGERSVNPLPFFLLLGRKPAINALRQFAVKIANALFIFDLSIVKTKQAHDVESCV